VPQQAANASEAHGGGAVWCGVVCHSKQQTRQKRMVVVRCGVGGGPQQHRRVRSARVREAITKHIGCMPNLNVFATPQLERQSNNQVEGSDSTERESVFTREQYACSLHGRRIVLAYQW
jgi:hypothetical protein